MGLVGALGAPAIPAVDACGRLVLGDCSLEWWIGADDRWHLPSEERAGVRQRRIGATPAYETAVRVPGGDARQRVYGVPPGLVVVEVDNDTGSPFAVAFVVRLVRRAGRCAVELDGRQLLADGVPVLQLPRPPRRWATAAGGSVRAEVTAGGGDDGPFVPVSGRCVEAALVYPVAHRTRLRVGFVTQEPAGDVDVAGLPAIDAVARGWERQLDRGMRTELPEPFQGEVDAARADALLAPPSAAAFVTLERWGFDAEAAAMWRRLRSRDRRAARRRAVDERGPLAEMHAALVREDGETVDVLPGFRAEWLGRNLAVHDIPLRRGRCSYAVRWHGARPALLFDAPPRTRVRAPALDPGWSSTEPVGEALLAAPPAALLGTGPAARHGVALPPPESFT